VGASRRNTATVLRLEVTAVNNLPDGSWKTPPVLQVSAVCLRNTPKCVTKKSFFTDSALYFFE
jgi:hypothetical protein